MGRETDILQSEHSQKAKNEGFFARWGARIDAALSGHMEEDPRRHANAFSIIKELNDDLFKSSIDWEDEYDPVRLANSQDSRIANKCDWVNAWNDLRLITRYPYAYPNWSVRHRGIGSYHFPILLPTWSPSISRWMLDIDDDERRDGNGLCNTNALTRPLTSHVRQSTNIATSASSTDPETTISPIIGTVRSVERYRTPDGRVYTRQSLKRMYADGSERVTESTGEVPASNITTPTSESTHVK